MSLVSTLASVSSPPPLLRVTISHQSATSPMSVCHAASTPTHTANRAAMMSLSPRGEAEGVGMWTEEEHARFLEAVKLFANGPWKRVADYVGTRSVRQTMTHAQKYRLKAARRLRSMRAKSDLLLKHHGSLGPMDMHSRLLPFGDKSDGAGVSTPSKKQQPKRAEGAAKPRRRRQYTSLDTVSITDAVSILDSSLLATTPIATAEARNAKMLTPTSSYNSSEDVRPAKLVKEEMTPIPASEPVIKIEEIVDEDMEDLAEVIDAILDSDLETCPSLEDCATELLDLLF